MNSSKYAKCNKDLPRGHREKIYSAPRLARFCFDCWVNWLAGFWKMKDIFVFEKGGFSRKKNVDNLSASC